MPRRLNLSWKSPAMQLPLGWRVALGVVGVAVLASATFWWRATEQLEAAQTQRAQQGRPPGGQSLSVGRNRGAAREEIGAVNQVIRQMNQQWDVLLADVQPMRKTVRLLAVEVDAKSQSVRLLGNTERVGEIVDYVAELSDRKSLEDVGLARHDADREHGGYQFVVEAKWADGR